MFFSKLKWEVSREVLDAEACLFGIDYFKRLFTLLAGFSDTRISTLKGVWCKSFVVLISEQENLPWLPGVQYFGRHKNAPNIYMPTQLKCSLKYDVIQNIIMREFKQGSYLLVPESKLIIPLIEARTLDRAFIQSPSSN